MSADTPIDSRTAVLARIRSALAEGAPRHAGKPGESRLPTEGATALQVLVGEWDTLPRDYQRSATLPLDARLELLEDRLRDYDAEVTRVAEDEVADAISAVLAARGCRAMLVPPGFPLHWLPASDLLVADTGFSPRELDHFDGVLTGAVAAIAETGSLVLQNVPGQGRRAANLVPDFHLCVVREEDVVESVPEAFDRLAGTMTLPTTFVSGPSATADIEMTRIKGVHGPRFLHVLLVRSQPISDTPTTNE